MNCESVLASSGHQLCQKNWIIWTSPRPNAREPYSIRPYISIPGEDIDHQFDFDWESSWKELACCHKHSYHPSPVSLLRQWCHHQAIHLWLAGDIVSFLSASLTWFTLTHFLKGGPGKLVEAFVFPSDSVILKDISKLTFCYNILLSEYELRAGSSWIHAGLNNDIINVITQILVTG